MANLANQRRMLPKKEVVMPLGALQWHRVFVLETCSILVLIHVYVDSVHFVNLLTFEIALLHKLETAKLQTNFETGIRFRSYATQF